MADRHRYQSPGQNWVSQGVLMSNNRPESPPSTLMAAGARPPVSHHLHLGAMVPKAMGFTPALQDGHFHRGWERPELTLDVIDRPTTPPRPTTPLSLQRSRTASRIPISHNGSQRSPPDSQRSYRNQQSPPESQRSYRELPESQRSYRESRQPAPSTPPTSNAGQRPMQQLQALQRGGSFSTIGAAGSRTPVGDHMNLGSGYTPAVGFHATAHGGGGGVFFPRELQQNPAPLWHAGDQSSGYVHALRQPQVTPGVMRQPAASTETYGNDRLSLFAA